jgi:GNAT superfamily N-acetyltransferase
MSSNEELRTVEFVVREWRPSDDGALVAMMQRQIEHDPGWPPGYARNGDLATWLGEPTTLGRWVAVNSEVPVGHIGNSPVHAGPIADLWCEALRCEVANLAEICRLVVDPRWRRHGVSDLMTRKAIRAALTSGAVPVANALSDRDASLQQMLHAGWRNVGRATSPRTGLELVALIPPQSLVDKVMKPRA